MILKCSKRQIDRVDERILVVLAWLSLWKLNGWY